MISIDDIIYILSGFVKKTQKTPLNEIKKAHRIMKGLGL
jgi:phage-related protein